QPCRARPGRATAAGLRSQAAGRRRAAARSSPPPPAPPPCACASRSGPSPTRPPRTRGAWTPPLCDTRRGYRLLAAESKAEHRGRGRSDSGSGLQDGDDTASRQVPVVGLRGGGGGARGDAGRAEAQQRSHQPRQQPAR
ncbi:unnamed protein product, partial [Plutella xylostella]